MASKRPAILSVFVRMCICSFPVPRAAPQIWPVRQKMPQTDSLPPWAFATFCKGLQPIVEGIKPPCGDRGCVFSGHASPSGRFRPVFSLYARRSRSGGRINPGLLTVSLCGFAKPEIRLCKKSLFLFQRPLLFRTQRGNGQAGRPLSFMAHTHRVHSSGGSFSFAPEILRASSLRGFFRFTAHHRPPG